MSQPQMSRSSRSEAPSSYGGGSNNSGTTSRPTTTTSSSSSSSSPASSSSSSSSSIPLHEKINNMIGKCLKFFCALYEPLTRQLFRHMYGEQQSVVRMRSMLTSDFASTNIGSGSGGGGNAPAVDLEHLDAQNIINLLIRAWPDIQKIPNSPLSPSFRNYLFELKTVRNKWAHQYHFELRDAYRALDTFERVLSLPMLGGQAQASEARKMFEYVLLHYANEIKRKQQREQQELQQQQQHLRQRTTTSSSSIAPQHPIGAPQQPVVHQQQVQQQQQQQWVESSNSADDDALFSDYMEIEE